MKNAEIIGNELRKLRKTKGLTQAQLSGLAVLSATYYSNLERGLISRPSLETLFKIAYALDMKPHEIIKIMESKVKIIY